MNNDDVSPAGASSGASCASSGASCVPYLCVYASQAAACIGENPHKKMGDAVEQVWERADRAGFRAALRRNAIVTDDDVLARALTAHPEVTDIMKAADVPAGTSAEVASKYASLSSRFKAFAGENKLDRSSVRVVDDALRKTSYTTYGNQQESTVFEYVRDTLGVDCVEDTTFYKVQAGVVDTPRGGVPWYIGGKIDGISADRSLVIEIKNRVNRLFRRPPSYEMVQIQTYLELLGVDRGVLVECLRARGAVDVNVIPVTRNRDVWRDQYLPKLTGFVDFVGKIVHDEALQDKFLRSKRRSAVVAAHVAKFTRP